MTEEYVCEVCGRKCKGILGLKIHMVRAHEIKLKQKNDHSIGLTYIEKLNIDNMVFLYEDVLWGIHNKDLTLYWDITKSTRRQLNRHGLVQGGHFNFPVLTPLAIMKLYTHQLNQIFEKLKIEVLD